MNRAIWRGVGIGCAVGMAAFVLAAYENLSNWGTIERVMNFAAIIGLGAAGGEAFRRAKR